MAVQQQVYLFWGESDEDDITRLPKNWEARVADDGRIYFLHHETKTTCWESPLTHQRYKVEKSLPYGWQKYTDDEGFIYFVDHLNQYSSAVDPRLLTDTVFDLSTTYHIKRTNTVAVRFRPLVRAASVMEKIDLSQKTAIVTGGNSGLGFRTALHLAARGAHVILACRHMTRASTAVLQIQCSVPDAKVEAMELDLASLHSVQNFADTFQQRNLPLHILVLNAAVFGGPLSLTVDGIERHFAINHLGHFYLTNLLSGTLERSAPSRVVVVASESHWYTTTNPTTPLHIPSLPHPPKHTYTPITAYGASKLCNLLFALEFHRRFSLKGITCNAVHPGNLLATNLTRDAGILCRLSLLLARPFTKSVVSFGERVLHKSQSA
jgi:WW domain-containing oxidoreductase